MSHFKAKMHQILFPASVRPSVRPSHRCSLTLKVKSFTVTENFTATIRPTSFAFVEYLLYNEANEVIEQAENGWHTADVKHARSWCKRHTLAVVYRDRVQLQAVVADANAFRWHSSPLCQQRHSVTSDLKTPCPHMLPLVSRLFTHTFLLPAPISAVDIVWCSQP